MYYYKEYVYKGWRYRYNTVKDEHLPDKNKPWMAWVEKPPTEKEKRNNYFAASTVVKRLYFAKRVSAQRAAERWYHAHIKKIETQAALRAKGYIAPGQLCGGCESNRRDQDDYLCKECRYG